MLELDFLFGLFTGLVVFVVLVSIALAYVRWEADQAEKACDWDYKSAFEAALLREESDDLPPMVVL